MHDLTVFSNWYLAEDNIMHITLHKRDKGQTWSSPIMGQAQLDPYAADLEQRRLMLQRFQEEVHHLNSSPKTTQVLAFDCLIDERCMFW